MGTTYDDDQTHQEQRAAMGVLGGAATFLGPVAGKLAAAYGVGAAAGNELGHYIDGRNGMGIDPETGRDRDVFDLAAAKGMDAEKWVEGKLGAQEGDGSWGDKLGGLAGGATAGALGAFGSLAVGAMDAKDAAVNLFGGMFD